MKACNDWCYCNQCSQVTEYNVEKQFLFIKGNDYKAYFGDYCQGKRNVIEVQAGNGETLDFIPYFNKKEENVWRTNSWESGYPTVFFRN